MSASLYQVSNKLETSKRMLLSRQLTGKNIQWFIVKKAKNARKK